MPCATLTTGRHFPEDSSPHGRELSGFVKGEEFFDHLNFNLVVYFTQGSTKTDWQAKINELWRVVGCHRVAVIWMRQK